MKAAIVALGLLWATPSVASGCLDLPVENELNNLMDLGGAYKSLKGDDQITRAMVEYEAVSGEYAIRPDYVIIAIAATLTAVMLVKDERVCQGIGGPMTEGNLQLLRRIEGNAS